VTDLDESVFRSFAFWAGILAVKVIFMSPLTSLQRVLNDCYASPEDVVAFGRNKKLPQNRVVEAIERIRRAHLNDLENIPVFFALALVFCFTHPSTWLASTLFGTFTIARIVHTFVYAIIPMQPWRVIAFVIGQIINIVMAIRIVLYFC